MLLQEGRVTVNLTIEGYQFPTVLDEAWDSDWLCLTLRLQVGDQQWVRTDPAVTTFEWRRLAEWLDEVATHAEVFGRWTHERLLTQCEFTEPNLSLVALSGHPTGRPVSLRLVLTAEYLPPPSLGLSSSPHGPAEVWLEFSQDQSSLRDLAAQVRQSLQRFPVRVGLPARDLPFSNR